MSENDETRGEDKEMKIEEKTETGESIVPEQIFEKVQWHDSTLKNAVERMESIVKEQQEQTRIEMLKCYMHNF